MIDETLLEAEEKMEKAVAVAKEDFSGIRTGRVTPSMFNKINVDYYGSPTPIQQLASFHVPEARMVLVQPYDKGSLNAIEKAIRDSDLGVNPGNDGAVIRVVFPELSQERRKEYVKIARNKAEAPGSPCGTSAVTPRTSWTRWSRTARPVRTRSTAR